MCDEAVGMSSALPDLLGSLITPHIGHLVLERRTIVRHCRCKADPAGACICLMRGRYVFRNIKLSRRRMGTPIELNNGCVWVHGMPGHVLEANGMSPLVKERPIFHL